MQKGGKGDKKGHDIDSYSLSELVYGDVKGNGMFERCTNRES